MIRAQGTAGHNPNTRRLFPNHCPVSCRSLKLSIVGRLLSLSCVTCRSLSIAVYPVSWCSFSTQMLTVGRRSMSVGPPVLTCPAESIVSLRLVDSSVGRSRSLVRRQNRTQLRVGRQNQHVKRRSGVVTQQMSAVGRNRSGTTTGYNRVLRKARGKRTRDQIGSLAQSVITIKLIVYHNVSGTVWFETSRSRSMSGVKCQVGRSDFVGRCHKSVGLLQQVFDHKFSYHVSVWHTVASVGLSASGSNCLSAVGSLSGERVGGLVGCRSITGGGHLLSAATLSRDR